MEPQAAVDLYGVGATLVEVRRQLHAACPDPDCWVNAGMELPPDVELLVHRRSAS